MFNACTGNQQSLKTSGMNNNSSNNSKQITIPTPCHEDWGKMSPQQKGRHCASCDKVVVDFTKSSKKEIIDHLETAEGKTCGRFTSDQISRSHQTSNLAKIAASIMAIVGTQTALNAQVGQVMIMGEAVAPDHSITINALNTVPYKLVGIVHSETGKALTNAKVSVYSSGKMVKSVMTDENGNYSLEFPEGSISTKSIDLRVFSPGNDTTKITDLELKKVETTLNITVNNREEILIMGKVACTEPIEHVKGEIAVTEEPSESFLGNAIVEEATEPEVLLGDTIVQTHTDFIWGDVTIESQDDTSSLLVESETEEVNDGLETVTYIPSISLPDESEGEEVSTSAPSSETTTQPETPIVVDELTIMVDIFPNPASDYVKVRLGEKGEYHYMVTNILGDKVYDGFFNSDQVEFSFRNQSPGVYLINLYQNDDLIVSKKLVITN